MAIIIHDSAWRDIAIHQTALISLRREWDKTARFCPRIHARNVRPTGALFPFCALRGLADSASGFRQSSALVAPVKNCIHPSTVQRASSWWRETRRISFSAEVLCLSQFSCNLWRHSANLFSLPIFFYRPPVCTYFPRRFYPHHRCRLFVILLSRSLLLRIASLFLLNRAVSPFGQDHIHHPRQPNLGICWGLHLPTPRPQWLLSTSMKGSLVAGLTRRRFTMYLHFHVSALNFVLFAIVRVIFACPHDVCFENIFVHKKIANEVRKSNLFIESCQ